MGDVFSISSDPFYEPLLGHRTLIKWIKASVEPQVWEKSKGKHKPGTYCKFDQCELGKSENEPLYTMLSQGQFYLDNPQAVTLLNAFGLLMLHKYISIHYHTKFAMLIGFAFNNQSSFSRLTHLWLQLECLISFFLNCM